jgi:hypothetical protein
VLKSPESVESGKGEREKMRKRMRQRMREAERERLDKKLSDDSIKTSAL